TVAPTARSVMSRLSSTSGCEPVFVTVTERAETPPIPIPHSANVTVPDTAAPVDASAEDLNGTAALAGGGMRYGRNPSPSGGHTVPTRDSGVTVLFPGTIMTGVGYAVGVAAAMDGGTGVWTCFFGASK